MGVVWAEDADAVGEGLFVEGDGLGEVSRLLICVREVVA